jgi:transcriptional antiterminator RfaH
MWHDRKKFVDEPLFPSYIFVYLTAQENFYQGLEIDGVLYYVRSGKEIARVSESIIEGIQLMMSSGYELEVSPDRFDIGRQLVISKGILAGLSCELVKYQGKDKVLLRVNLLRQNVLLSLHPDYLLATP